MDNLGYVISLTLALSMMSLVTRLVPFVFSKMLVRHQWLRAVGSQLPAYVMLLLVLYEVGLRHFFQSPYGVPALVALLVVGLVHVWKRQTLLSIFSGTLVYILISRL